MVFMSMHGYGVHLGHKKLSTDIHLDSQKVYFSGQGPFWGQGTGEIMDLQKVSISGASAGRQ